MQQCVPQGRETKHGNSLGVMRLSNQTTAPKTMVSRLNNEIDDKNAPKMLTADKLHLGMHNGKSDWRMLKLLVSKLCSPSGSVSGVQCTSGAFLRVCESSCLYVPGVDLLRLPQTVN